MQLSEPVYRPPSEARSLLIQATEGCSHNRCTFCAMYRTKRYVERPVDEVCADIREAATRWPRIRRAFLCDGDALGRTTEDLLAILRQFSRSFPELQRVGIYANAWNILDKSALELDELRREGLGIVYLGLESGDDDVLRNVAKGATSDEMVRAVQHARESGIETSVIVLLGLGGVDNSSRHARLSAEAVSRMQPSYLSALTLMVVPGTPLHKNLRNGRFRLPDERGILTELRELIASAELENTVFRTNHASNYLPLAGVLSRDAGGMVEAIDDALAGRRPLRPDFLRGL